MYEFQDIINKKVRFLRKDKKQFIELIKGHLDRMGYSYSEKVSKGLINSHNLETESEACEFVVMAHYDTPTIMPFWMELPVRLFGHTRPFLMILGILGVFILLGVFDHLLWVQYLDWIITYSLLSLLIPNWSNLNDNTSGVLGVLQIAKKVSQDDELRRKVKFVFMDNEENVLLGATKLKQEWDRDRFNYANAQIISLDCIGQGEIPVIIRNGSISKTGDGLFEIFEAAAPHARQLNMKGFPLNDNFIFSGSGAVLVAMMEKSLLPGGLYIKNIHSPLDNKLDLEKVDFVSESIMTYLNKKGKGTFQNA